MHFHFFSILITLLTLTITPITHAKLTETIRVADASEVEKCQQLNTITLDSGYSKHNYSWQRHLAHKSLLQAQSIGATHLVINKIERIGAFNGMMYSTAYQCPSSTFLTKDSTNDTF